MDIHLAAALSNLPSLMAVEGGNGPARTWSEDDYYAQFGWDWRLPAWAQRLLTAVRDARGRPANATRAARLVEVG